MKYLEKREIGILVGGNSTEFDASILSYESVVQGCNVADSSISIRKVFFIDDNKLIIHDMDIPLSESDLRNGGICKELSDLPMELKKANLYFFSLLHGNEGEDGEMQGLADIYGIEGSFGSVFSACTSINKWAMAELVDSLTSNEMQKIPYTKITPDCDLGKVEEFVLRNGMNFVLKPNRLGASLFTKKIKRDDVLREVAELKGNGLFNYDNIFLLQKYIEGREFTVGVIEKEGDTVVLPIVEVFTEENFLGHDEKHKKNMVDVSFDKLEDNIKERLVYFSKYIFKEFDFSNFCRFDFIYKDGQIFFLEANSIPGLMKSSIFPKMLDNAGISVCDMIYYFIDNLKCKKSQLSKKYRYVIEE